MDKFKDKLATKIILELLDLLRVKQVGPPERICNMIINYTKMVESKDYSFN